MTTYLLDTNACIALINGREVAVRRQFRRAVGRNDLMLLSSVVAFELWSAAAKVSEERTIGNAWKQSSRARLNGRSSTKTTPERREPFAPSSNQLGRRSARTTSCWPVRRVGGA
jgi:hypothetical protein